MAMITAYFMERHIVYYIEYMYVHVYVCITMVSVCVVTGSL